MSIPQLDQGLPLTEEAAGPGNPLETALIARLANEFYSEGQRGVQAPTVTSAVPTAITAAPVPAPTVPTAVAGFPVAAPQVPAVPGVPSVTPGLPSSVSCLPSSRPAPSVSGAELATPEYIPPGLGHGAPLTGQAVGAGDPFDTDMALIARLANEFYSEVQRGVQAPTVPPGVPTAFATAPVPTPTVPTAVVGLPGAAPGVPVAPSVPTGIPRLSSSVPDLPSSPPMPSVPGAELATPAGASSDRSLTGGYPSTSPAAPVHPILEPATTEPIDPSLSLNRVHMIRAAGIPTRLVNRTAMAPPSEFRRGGSCFEEAVECALHVGIDPQLRRDLRARTLLLARARFG